LASCLPYLREKHSINPKLRSCFAANGIQLAFLRSYWHLKTIFVHRKKK
jgi:hypothetical protein